MRVLLLSRDDEFDAGGPLPPNEADLRQDLGLDGLLDAMASGDSYLSDVARAVILRGAADPAAVRYRQDVLRDCLEHPEVVRQIYRTAVDAIENERHAYGGLLATRQPVSILGRSANVIERFLGPLRQLRDIARRHAGDVRSVGLRRLFDTLQQELDDAYLAEIERHLRTVRFRGGILASAELGQGNKGVNYTLREPRDGGPGLMQRLSGRSRSGSTIVIDDHDESGANAVSELRDRAINPVANALAQSADHVLGFFRLLRAEVGFYVGCLNLHGALTAVGGALCFPDPQSGGAPMLRAQGLYDPGLALRLDATVVGNDLDADDKALVMITGANQGGKSTFLRALGLAQLMMQSGMFVAARSYRAGLVDGLFTHFRREEDETMTSGKLDEELRRMSDIVDSAGPGALLLCNESFAATNEREGSEIARQVISALVDSGVRVVFVTHLYDLASRIYRLGSANAVFLRADRRSDGSRTYRLTAGEPLPTSFGADLFREVFGTDPDGAG